MQSFNNLSGSLLTAVAMAVASASLTSAHAATTFQVAPSVLGGPAAPFTASALSGIASTRVTVANPSGSLIAGNGLISFTGFNNPPPFTGGVAPGISGLGVNYNLWLTYSYTALLSPLSTQTFGQAGSIFNINSLTFTVFGQQGLGTNFTAATLTAAPSVVVGGSGIVRTIGSGSLLNGSPNNTLGLNGTPGGAPTGAFFNSDTTYANTAFGNTFFFDPSPFYAFAFNSFINDAPGLLIGTGLNAGVIAINQQIGNASFAGTVPTPSTLALVGLALVACGFVARRKTSVQ